MFHALTATLVKTPQLLSFSINYRFLHHSFGFGCATDFSRQLMENSHNKPDKYNSGKRLEKGRPEMLPRHIKSLEVLKYVPHIPIGTETSDSCWGHTPASTMNKGSPETEASTFEVFTIANERNCIIQANWTQWLVTENLALFCTNSNRAGFFLFVLFLYYFLG